MNYVLTKAGIATPYNKITITCSMYAVAVEPAKCALDPPYAGRLLTCQACARPMRAPATRSHSTDKRTHLQCTKLLTQEQFYYKLPT